MDRRTFCVRLFGIPALLGMSRSPLLAAEPPVKVARWQTDFYKAHELALEQDKPLLVVFGASWCGYCHKMERETLADPKLSERIADEFVPVHLDLDRNKAIARALEVQSIPCAIVLSPNADLLGRQIGYASAEKFQQTLTTSLAQHTRIRQTRHTEE